MATRKELEARLSLKQREAALLLVENELSDTKDQLTQEEIAEQLGITRQGLYKWRTQNKTFIEYKNMIADDFFNERRDRVYRQLFKLIDAPQPSVKAIDLYMRRHGLLTDKTVVEDATQEGQRSNEALEKELAELDGLLDD